MIGPWQRLRDEMAAFSSEPYLLTVTAGRQPHCGIVEVTCAEDRLMIASPGTRGVADAAEHPQISLLWPPAAPGGYSLIVDGVAAAPAPGEDAALVVRPTRAVLHRRGPAADPQRSTCGSDCIPILP